MPFRLADHTADVAIEAWGPDAGTVLADAGTALASLVTGRRDPRRLRPDTEIRVRLEAPDAEALAVAFLSEVLWRLESSGQLWLAGGARVGTTAQGLAEVEAVGNAATYDPERHGRGVEVKAVTYHGLAFAEDPARPTGQRWRLWVLLDI